jgi:hypothetical protein
MQQTDRFFGMTRRQLGILAGLAAAACLLFGLAGWLSLRGRLNRSPNAQQDTPLSQFTATPWTIPSPAPSGTATPIPYATLIPSDWGQFKTGLVEIWLPAEFQAADSQLFNNSFNTAIGELILTHAREDTTAYPILVIVSYEPLTTNSLDVFLDGEVGKTSSDFRLAERRKVTLNATEVVRFVFEGRFKNVEVNDLTYVFLDGGTVWYVEYIAQINEFYEMLAVFEKSAQTFRVVR